MLAGITMPLADLSFLTTFPAFCPDTGAAVPVIFCSRCSTSITGGGSEAANSPISHHITTKHGPCTLARLNALIHSAATPSLQAAIAYWAAQPQFTKLPPRPDDSDPLPALPVLQGYECQVCRARRLNYKSMQRHVSKGHADECREKAHWGGLIRLISMQTWFPTQPGGRGVWWRVVVEQTQTEPAPAPAPEPETICKVSSVSAFSPFQFPSLRSITPALCSIISALPHTLFYPSCNPSTLFYPLSYPFYVNLIKIPN
jgi:hypothetical protein